MSRIPKLQIFTRHTFPSWTIKKSFVQPLIRQFSVHRRTFDESTSSPERPKVTLANLRKMYMTNQKIAVMTAYDFPSGTFADRAGSDIVLVGDSLGMVCLGYESTNQVTLSVYPCINNLKIGYDSSL